MRPYSLEHKERYNIVIVGENNFHVLQVPRDFLLCHLI